MDYILSFVSELSLERIIYYLLGYICHQDKTILFGIGENLIPLCPRCLGLHAGFFLTLVFIKLLFQKPIDIDKPCNLFIIILSICFAGIHWSLGFFGLMEMNFTSRVFTGLVSGAGFYLLLNSLKYKFLQLGSTVSAWSKILFVCLLVLSLCIILLDDYELFLLTILVLVTSNMISIINFIWLIIKQNNNYNHSF
jgi:uncharacterized membrane protein